MSILIRKETASDIEAINDVTIAAFMTAPHTDHTEQFIVNALRHSGALSISLVAQKGENIIGHVAVSLVSISDGSENWYGLGPISVVPSEQGHGVGSQLMDTALAELKRLNAQGCVLLGDLQYYQRFGFKPLEQLILAGVPMEYFQALVLKGKQPRGEVTYHSAFTATA
ncbi:N-acetyltransferase [Shewanella sp. Isolate11]|uniref:GNAT family N-acetyltransferase n=1 Tax=Shewanella sp. Isolate11 TaxID=2908530 RepID=UPI001EFCF155|nr:N-acetyltransferase [Shewanella sp. Isolate11]MCG9697022.1 N-acetyltransferase [Shewanella sp. Isolate11]